MTLDGIVVVLEALKDIQAESVYVPQKSLQQDETSMEIAFAKGAPEVLGVVRVPPIEGPPLKKA